MLKNTIELVSALKLRVQGFYDTYKEEIRYDKKLNTCFIDFFNETDITIYRLKNPVITIATVGTTSSGKSTILNSFIGRDIAPCNIDEMSAGILTFTPSETENKLIIKESPEGYWQEKILLNVPDDKMREEIEKVFGTYKKQKIHKHCTAPQIEMKGQFLWNVYPKMFDLTKDIKFKFIDLPGLRREKGDRKNLKVIQDVLKDVKPLCVLAMDYSCLATPEALESLLSELSETIKNLGGSTESIIFLLNKVDLYNEGQATSLEDDINKFRNRVIAKLSSELPKYNFDNIKLIPYIGILHNNAQLSIGLHHHKYDEILSANIDNLARLNANCSKVFENTTDDEIYDFYKSIQRKLRRREEIESEDLHKLVQSCYTLSYADVFVEELKRRIKDSFYEIVIYPSIFRFQQKFQLLNAYLNNFLSVNRLRNQFQIHSRIFGILESQVKLLGLKDEQRPSFVQKIEESLEEIKTITTEFSNRSEEFQQLLVSEEWESIPNEVFDLEECFLKLYNEQKILLSSHFIGDEDLLEKMNEELKRKHSLYLNYLKLKKTATSGAIEGKLRQEFQKTIDANLQASNALSEYAESCSKNYRSDYEKIRAREKAHQTIASIEHSGISSLYSDCLEILQRIKSLIEYDLLHPFKKVYPITSYSESDLENDLRSKGIKESSIKSLVDQFTIFRTQFSDWEYKSIEDNAYIVYNNSTKPSNYEFSSYTRKYKALNNEIRLAISDLMGYNVQLEYKGFVDNLKSILDKDTQVILDKVNESGFDVNVAGIIKLLAIECKITPEIPEDIFTFADPYTMTSYNESRTRTIEGVCCDDYETYTEKMYKVKYPTIDGLYSNWSRGISGSEKNFWYIVVDWVNSTISQQRDKIESAILTVSKEVLGNLTEQKEKLQNGSARRNNLLDEMDSSFKENVILFNKVNNESYE